MVNWKELNFRNIFLSERINCSACLSLVWNCTLIKVILSERSSQWRSKEGVKSRNFGPAPPPTMLLTFFFSSLIFSLHSLFYLLLIY